jgi:hypothetical protein
MKKDKTLKNYVSDLDQFLQNFDKKHPKFSLSQQQEHNKHRRVYYLRDVANRPEPKKEFEGF